jgi:hypothetical protein
LKQYINVTNSLENNDTDHIFVAFGGGNKGKVVSSRTIAGWLVSVIRLAYEERKMTPPQVKAHSTRGMATSWGLFQKASLEQILQAADWQSENTFIKHYRLHISGKRVGPCLVPQYCIQTHNELKCIVSMFNDFLL